MTAHTDPLKAMLNRRGALAVIALAGAGVAAGGGVAVAATASPDPEAAFRAAFAATPSRLPDADARIRFLLPEAVVVDHDVPFPLGVAEYADHLRFKLAETEALTTVLHDLAVVRHGETAVVSCFFNERSKPKDGGFRLRAGFCTAHCVTTPDGWRALSLHIAPLSSQILDASPG